MNRFDIAQTPGPGTALPQRLLHITHARQDEAWVRGVLIPALALTEDQLWMRAENDLHSLQLEELERAVESCRYTLLVASSAARVDEWTQLAGLLAQHLGVEEGKPRLLVVTRDFDPESERARELLPLRQRCLACLDCSDPQRSAAGLATLAAQLALTTTAEAPAECPYPGLRMFGTGDVGSCFDRFDLFFGRDEEGHQIVDQLRASRRALLVGPSGCGKSSLVRARVLPALARGAGAMEIAVVRPGQDADGALRTALASLDPRLAAATDPGLAGADRTGPRTSPVEAAALRGRLVYVDQFEEVFLDGSHEHASRVAFFARLAALARVPGVAILLGMRADFYGDLMRSPAWDDFKDHRIELAPLRGGALREAIVRPAERVGVHVEVDLVERLVREADQDRAAEALPLLQVALEQLWAHREWRYLSLASYARIADGDRRGLDVVLARHADNSLARLAGPLQNLARRVLIDLVHLGEGRPDTRRRRSSTDLRRAGDHTGALDMVLAHLSAQRLITVGAEVAAATSVHGVALPSAGSPAVVERHVDLAHDTLITGWPTLARWVTERRDDLRTQRRLEARAAGGGLLAASELPEFIRWVAWIDTPAGQVLGASEALRALVHRSARVRRAQRMRLISSLLAVIVVLSVAAVIALWQQQRASEEAERANHLLAQSYQEAGRQQLLDQHPQEAIPYLVAAREMGAQGEALRMLIRQASLSLPVVAPLEHRNWVYKAAFSPDGTRIVTASADNTARVWDTATGRPLTPPLVHQKAVLSASFSHDGARVVTASDHTARVWDAVTGRPLTPPLSHQSVVKRAELSPDGKRIVTASWDHTARIWDATTGKLLTILIGHQESVTSAAFSPDGTRVITASDDHTARIWDAATGKPLTPPLEHAEALASAVFSPDGTRVVTASGDRTARIWDAATGRPLTLPLEHRELLFTAELSPDGTRVVTASQDNTTRVWDAATGKLLTSFDHAGDVRSAAFSPDGTLIVTASGDFTARVWDAATGRPVTAPLPHQGLVRSAVFSPDGTRVATAGDDNTARIWDVASSKLFKSPRLSHQEGVVGAVFSPDGTRVVTASKDDTARVWDAATGKLLTSLQHQGDVRSAAFSPDGTRIVTASEDHSARVWQAAGGKPLLSLTHGERVNRAAFSPDGTRIATASDDHSAGIWDVATGKRSAVLPHMDPVMSIAFSPDGARVVTASFDDTARIWDVATGKPLALPLQHQEAVIDATFSPDGTRIITASWDNTARVWDAITGKPLTAPLLHMDRLTGARFSPDGTRIVTTSHDETVRVWNAATGEPLVSPPLHLGAVNSAAFSPDGTRVITAGQDHTAQIWDTATGKLLTVALRHQEGVRSAVFSSSGTHVITASADGTARVWEIGLEAIEPARWRALAERSPFVLSSGVPVLRGSLAHGDSSR